MHYTSIDRSCHCYGGNSINGVFDHTFSDSSYGFRKGRSAHDAISAALEHISEGYKVVVDIDLGWCFTKYDDAKMAPLSTR
ncbi:MAG: hypothetical protein LBU89_12145 [Fibromonadaceae bacterium]|nr:hypothetical protein [Fibromonadaceae bacterium]